MYRIFKCSLKILFSSLTRVLTYGNWASIKQRDLRCSQRRCWRFRPSEVLHFVEWEVVTDVSKDLIVFISMVNRPNEELSSGYDGSRILRNVGNSLPNDTHTHSVWHRLESSAAVNLLSVEIIRNKIHTDPHANRCCWPCCCCCCCCWWWWCCCCCSYLECWKKFYLKRCNQGLLRNFS